MTTRIRWTDETPGNSDVYNIAHTGYVGTVEEPAFIIYTPDDLHVGWLLSVRVAPGSQFLYADSADELKAEAERWLERFVSSLGAVFPEAFLELADEWEQEAKRLQQVAREQVTRGASAGRRGTTGGLAVAHVDSAKALREAVALEFAKKGNGHERDRDPAGMRLARGGPEGRRRGRRARPEPPRTR